MNKCVDIDTSRLVLVLPTSKHKEQVEEYKRAMIENNSSMDGCGTLKGDQFDVWLKRTIDFGAGKNLPEGWVAATQYIAIRKSDNKLVGMLQIRHEISTPHLFKYAGHIGDSVAPDERGKGYATEMLALGLKECKKLGIDKVLVTCKNTNIASEKHIIKNGGIFENEVELDDEKLKRFWINLK